MVTSSPSRIQTVPSPRSTSQRHLAHGSRSIRAGTLVRIVSSLPAVAAPSAMSRLSPRAHLLQTQPRLLDSSLIELGVDELVAPAELGDQGLLDLTGVDVPAELRRAAPGGRRLPFQPQSRVDRLESAHDLASAGGDDHATQVSAATDHALADAGELHGTAGVDAVGARAILARHLTDPRVDAEFPQRRSDQIRHLLEACVGALGWLRIRVRPGD